MKLYNQPTRIETLKTFQDAKGNQYELRGQQSMYSENGCYKTNYYELYKKEPKSKEFVKYGTKEEMYLDSYYGHRPFEIKKERLNKNTGKLTEAYEIIKRLNGYDIECKNEALTMNEPLRVLYANDSLNRPVSKVKIPAHMNIFGHRPLSNMTKRIFKLLSLV